MNANGSLLSAYNLTYPYIIVHAKSSSSYFWSHIHALLLQLVANPIMICDKNDPSLHVDQSRYA